MEQRNGCYNLRPYEARAILLEEKKQRLSLQADSLSKKEPLRSCVIYTLTS